MFNLPDKSKTECHSATINVGTSMTKLRLLVEREVNWTIENFGEMVESIPSLNRQQVDLCIEKHEQLPRTNWVVRLEAPQSFSYIRNFYDLSVRVYAVDRTNLPDNYIYTKIELEVISEDGTVWNKYSTVDPRNKEFDGLLDIKEARFYSRTLFKLEPKSVPVMGRDRKLPVRKDKSLVFRLTFEFYMRRFIRKMEQVQKRIPEVEESWLKRFEAEAEFATERVSVKTTDVQVISNDGKTFLFHKELLIERSPVFEAMFRSQMKESESGVVTLDDVSEDGVQFLWDFIYNGKIQPYIEKIKNAKGGGGILEQWVYIASKYQLDVLINFFDRNLGTWCTLENAMDLLRLSNRFSLKAGRGDVKAFITRNPDLLDNV